MTTGYSFNIIVTNLAIVVVILAPEIHQKQVIIIRYM